MYMTERIKEALPKVVDSLLGIPGDLYFGLEENEGAMGVAMQGWNQAQAADVRALFPGLIWKKSYNNRLSWWEYESYSPTLDCLLNVYGVTEAPPTCTVTRRTIEVEERVPVAFETQMVQKEIVEVHCGE